MTVAMDPLRVQALRSLGWISLVTFLTEYLIMALLPLVSLDINPWLEILLDAMAITVVLATVSHYAIFPALARRVAELTREEEEEGGGVLGTRPALAQSTLQVVLLKFGLATFMAESGVMLVGPLISETFENHQAFGLLDAALLTVIMAPVTYSWILKDFWRKKPRWQQEIPPEERQRMQVRLFLSVFIPALVFLALLHLGLYQSERHAARKGVESDVNHHLEIVSRELQGLFQLVRNDLLILSRQVELQELLEGEAEARELLERDYIHFLGTRTVYSHIALVTLGGQEMVRVEERQGGIRPTPWNERRNRALDEHYQLAVQLNAGEVHIGGIHFLQDNGVPVIWFAIPVFQEEHHIKRGVLFVAVKVEAVRRILDLPGSTAMDHLYLLDDRGEVMIQRQGGKIDSLPRHFPQAWAEIKGQERGVLRNAEGFFSFVAVRTLGMTEGAAPVVEHGHGGGHGQVGISPPSPMVWSLVSHVTPSSEEEVMAPFVRRLVMLCILLSSLLAGGSWHLARSVLMKRLAESELAGYAWQLEKMVEERTKQLVHAERLASLGTFSAGMAHEINNPNSFISGNVQFLQMVWRQLKPFLEKQLTAETNARLVKAVNEVGPTLDGILDGSRRIAKITDSLKTYSRGGGEADKVDCRLLDSVNDALTLLKHRLREGVSVVVELPSAIMIHGDRQQISQVYVNLVNNALDAMEGAGMGLEKRITLKAEVIDDHVWARVMDNGPGIPPEAAGKIFDPFYTTKGKTKGTGLGLSIVHGIIEDHRGQITVFSAPGRETEFLIILPTLSLYRRMHTRKPA